MTIEGCKCGAWHWFVGIHLPDPKFPHWSRWTQCPLCGAYQGWTEDGRFLDIRPLHNAAGETYHFRDRFFSSDDRRNAPRKAA